MKGEEKGNRAIAVANTHPSPTHTPLSRHLRPPYKETENQFSIQQFMAYLDPKAGNQSPGQFCFLCPAFTWQGAILSCCLDLFSCLSWPFLAAVKRVQDKLSWLPWDGHYISMWDLGYRPFLQQSIGLWWLSSWGKALFVVSIDATAKAQPSVYLLCVLILLLFPVHIH